MNPPPETDSPRGRWLEIVVLFAAFIVVNVAGALFQKQLSYHDGKGWEGVRYYLIAEEFARHQPIAAEAPFVYRAGTPFLAAHVCGDNLFLGFELVNLAANTLCLALLIVWLRLYVRDWAVRVVLGLMYVLQWDAPARFLWFYPIHTDPWLWVFLLTGLIASHHVRVDGPGARRWLALLCVTAFVGVLFREVALMVPLALPFARNPVTRLDGARNALRSMRWPPVVFFLPIGLGLLGWFLLRRSVTQTDTYSFARTAQQWLYTKSLPQIVQPWFLAFGPMIFLAVYDWRRAGRFLADHQFLLVYGLGFLVLAYLGGSDSERLNYWNMPVVYVLIGRAIEANRPLLRSAPLVVTLAVCQLLGDRAFMLTPDYPNDDPARSIPLFTPGLGHHFSYLDTYSFFGSRNVEMISLAEYLVFGLVLFEWLNYRRRKLDLLVPAQG